MYICTLLALGKYLNFTISDDYYKMKHVCVLLEQLPYVLVASPVDNTPKICISAVIFNIFVTESILQDLETTS